MKKEHSERHYFREPAGLEQSLPLAVVASGSSRWYRTEEFSRRHTGFWGVELVTLGSAVFVQDDREYRVWQGGVFVLRPGCTNRYGCGPEGVLHKRYLQIRGSAADRLFESCGLHRTDTLQLSRGQYRRAVTLLKSIHATFAAWSSDSPVSASVHAYELLLVLSEQRDAPRPANPYVEAALSWVQRNIASSLPVSACAAELGITPTHLNRLMAAHIGHSTKQHLLQEKMLVAANLLRETNASVASVAAQVGFGDPLYFSHAFRRHHGRSPAQYRTWIRQARS